MLGQFPFKADLLMASPCYLWKTDLLLFYDDLQISVPPTLCGFRAPELVMLAQNIQNYGAFQAIRCPIPEFHKDL